MGTLQDQPSDDERRKDEDDQQYEERNYKFMHNISQLI
jgi:hypothetical protein